jgi:hypothetical protein
MPQSGAAVFRRQGFLMLRFAEKAFVHVFPFPVAHRHRTQFPEVIEQIAGRLSWRRLIVRSVEIYYAGR